MTAGPSFSSAMVYAGVAGPGSSLAVLAVLSIALAAVAAWAVYRR